MNIALTNNLLIDLFFRDRSMARRIHATAGSLTGAKDPNEQIQWILHSEQIRYLDFRLSVVLDDNDLRLFQMIITMPAGSKASWGWSRS